MQLYLVEHYSSQHNDTIHKNIPTIDNHHTSWTTSNDGLDEAGKVPLDPEAIESRLIPDP